MKRFAWGLSAISVACLCLPAFAQVIREGRATVVDGDTLEVQQTRIRIWGIDAPERGAKCKGFDAYQRSARALSDLIGQSSVACSVIDNVDRYGRTVATCKVAGNDLGAAMVGLGWARDWPRYSHGRYAGEEEAARNAKQGLWNLSCPNLWRGRTYSQ